MGAPKLGRGRVGFGELVTREGRVALLRGGFLVACDEVEPRVRESLIELFERERTLIPEDPDVCLYPESSIRPHLEKWARGWNLLHRDSVPEHGDSVPEWVMEVAAVTLCKWRHGGQSREWSYPGFSASIIDREERAVFDPYFHPRSLAKEMKRKGKGFAAAADEALRKAREADPTLKKARWVQDPNQFRWVVQHQVCRLKVEDIASQSFRSSAAVKTAIQALKSALGLSLPRGRPRR